MMASKSLLILLVSLFVFINFFLPLVRQDEKVLKTLHLYEAKLSQENHFRQKSDEVEKLIADNADILKENEKLLYPSSMKESMAFNDMQTTIKRLVKKYEGKVVAITWGEPYIEEGSRYQVLPMRVVVQLPPEEIRSFLDDLLNKKGKLITFDQAMFVKKHKMVLLSLQMAFYRLKEVQ